MESPIVWSKYYVVQINHCPLGSSIMIPASAIIQVTVVSKFYAALNDIHAISDIHS